MNCPKCGQTTLDDSDFCSYCRADLRPVPVETSDGDINTPQILAKDPIIDKQIQLNCPVCGKEVVEGSDFCTFCGADVHLSPAAAATIYKPTPQVIPDSMKKTNGVAKAALICGAIPIVTSLIGFVLALVAIFLVDANRSTQKGMNLAVIGGMLSVMWMIVMVFAGFYFLNEEMGGTFGKTMLGSMKHSQSIQKNGALVLSLVPADQTETQQLAPDVVRSKIEKAGDIIEKRINESDAADGVIVTAGPRTLMLTIPGVRDRAAIDRIVTSTEGMPIRLKIINESQMKPGGFPTFDPEKTYPPDDKPDSTTEQ